MYLCYKVTVLINELFRLKKKRKGKNKKERKESTSIQIDPGREYFEYTKSLALRKELFNFFALS